MSILEEQIIEEYRWNYRVEAESYNMMGKLLDEDWVSNRVKLYQISDLYIYGGTYLAAQLFRTVKNYVNVKGIVDKGGRSVAKVKIPLFLLDEFKKLYVNEKIIITLPRYYKEVKAELLSFVNEEDILFLGDFLEGFC